MTEIEKIKNRKSYGFWVVMSRILDSNKNSSEKLLDIYNLLDKNYMFGTSRNSYFSLESLKTLIKEKDKLLDTNSIIMGC